VIQKRCPDKTQGQAREMLKIWIKGGVLYEANYDDPIERKERSGLRLDTTKRPA